MLWLSEMDCAELLTVFTTSAISPFFNRVHDVRAAFLHFVYRLHDDAVLFQVFGGAACGADAVAECLEVLRGFDDERFVFVAHGEEDFAGRVQAFACAELGL